jgi:hypothetical protein
LNLRSSPKLKAWLWFAGIYLLSLAVFAMLTGLLRFFIHA